MHTQSEIKNLRGHSVRLDIRAESADGEPIDIEIQWENKGCGGDRMSNRERILQLIEDVPDNKLIFIVNMLESLRAYADETIEPDEWDLKMIMDAEENNDGNTITLDELSKELGITL